MDVSEITEVQEGDRFTIGPVPAKEMQWNPSITDTIGTQHFVRYSEMSLTQGLPVYFR